MDMCFPFYGQIPKSGVSGSLMLNSLRNFQTVSQSVYTLYHFTFPPAVSESSHFSTSLLTLGMVSLVSHSNRHVVLYLIVVLISISLITYDVEHLFVCLLAICVSSLIKCLFESFACFFFLLLSFESSLYILNTSVFLSNILLGFTVKFKIHFELFLVYGVRYGSKFIYFAYGYLIVQHHLLKRLSFIHCIAFVPW